MANLERSMKFYGKTLGLELAYELPERNVAFYWIGGRGKSMLGLWETGSGPQRMSLHLAFSVELSDLLRAPDLLRKAGIEPRDLGGRPANEPVVLAWMPAAAIYFQDPDGHQVEFLCMLPDSPRPDLNIVSWSEWQSLSSGKN